MGARPSRFTFTRAALFAMWVAGCHATHRASTEPDPVRDAARPPQVEAGAAPAAAVPADDAIPAAATEELTSRVRHLLEAIATDNPELAADIEFPRDGWTATRDASDPGKDWEKRLAGPFRRGVHALARRHHDLERAQFVSIELSHPLNQTSVKKHGWKKALYSMSQSRITFVVDGRTRTLTIHEMTAWRGAWYVTRLR